MKNQKKMLRGSILFLLGMITVVGATGLANHIDGSVEAAEEGPKMVETKFERVDTVVAKGTYDEVSRELELNQDISRTEYIAVFTVDDVVYICGYDYKDDFAFEWFGISKSFKEYNPKYCYVYDGEMA